MFLNGTYASQWPSVGMLGYVQSDNIAAWLDGLARGFSSRKSKLTICSDQPNWQSAGWSSDGLTEVQESCHERTPRTLGKVRIYHLLLAFLCSGRACRDGWVASAPDSRVYGRSLNTSEIEDFGIRDGVVFPRTQVSRQQPC
jgi:hypothetical protein